MAKACAHRLELALNEVYRTSFGCWILVQGLPRACELLLAYTFAVSAGIALINMAPVFWLDGEAALAAALDCGSQLPRSVPLYLFTSTVLCLALRMSILQPAVRAVSRLFLNFLNQTRPSRSIRIPTTSNLHSTWLSRAGWFVPALWLLCAATYKPASLGCMLEHSPWPSTFEMSAP